MGHSVVEVAGVSEQVLFGLMCCGHCSGGMCTVDGLQAQSIYCHSCLWLLGAESEDINCPLLCASIMLFHKLYSSTNF